MKKNISINISGIIFHIEEDGYERLKKYLDGINAYFSTFDGNKEIIADIESRIAEIFLSKLDDVKQVITHEDVNNLIVTMGDVQDFKKVEDEVRPQAEETDYYEETEAQATTKKRLFRDVKRRVLGGVCSGIAYYFKLDPLWIRLIFIVLFFDLLVTQSIGPAVLVAYIILWIIVPPNNALVDDSKIKKLYRNPEDKVLGGVSSGIAAYFGVDATVIRLIFVITTFFGLAGLITYIILWIIVPEAKTITEKVQMKGDPVTLANIETSIKNSLNLKNKENEEESTVTKILLFPFRVIALVINELGRILGPIFSFLIQALRVIAGSLLVLIGFTAIVTFFVLLGAYFGLYGYDYVIHGIDIPETLITNTIPVLPLIAVAVVHFTISFIFILLGISLIVKRLVAKALVWWTLLALIVLGSLIFGLSFPRLITDFRESSGFEKTEYFQFEQAPVELKAARSDQYEYGPVSINLKSHQEEDWKIVRYYESRGANKAEAEQYASMITYDIEKAGQVLSFDKGFRFKEDAKYRKQKLYITVFIPESDTFQITGGMRDLLEHESFRPYGYSKWDAVNHNLWVFTSEGLSCISCPKSNNSGGRTGTGVMSVDSITSRISQIEIFGDGNIVLEPDNAFYIEAEIDGDEDDYRLETSGSNKLRLYTGNEGRNIRLHLPKVDSLILHDEVEVKGAIQQNEPLVIMGYDQVVGNIRFAGARMHIMLSDDFTLYATGFADTLNLTASSQSKFRGRELSSNVFTGDLQDESDAEVQVNISLSAETRNESKLKYTGRTDQLKVASRDDSEIIKF